MGVALRRRLSEIRERSLIANFGDGTINAYDAPSGSFRGQLKART